MTYQIKIYSKDGLYIATHIIQNKAEANKVSEDYTKMGLKVTLTTMGSYGSL